MRVLVRLLCPALCLALVAACSKSETPCQRAVAHVTRVVAGDTPANGAEDMVARCEAEGLSDAQLQCILAVDGVDGLMRLGACPAIAAKSPSWLIAPPP